MERREFLVLGAGLAMASAGCGAPSPSPDSEPTPERDVQFNGPARLARLQQAAGGTLGAWIMDTQSGKGFGIRGGERFGHCSSFKLSLAALVLHMADAGKLDLAEKLTWSERDLLAISPFTMERLMQGATIEELARAAQVFSDNAAANLLLAKVGGPPALTAFWRSLGDEESRLDRTEPALNNVPESEIRDTTTPAAMARTLATIATGDTLGENARRKLVGWMGATRTGMRRLRGDLPAAWSAGDKTGTSLWPGMRALYVDIALLQPPGGAAPLSVAAYYRASTPHEQVEERAEGVLATVGRIAADWQVFHSRN